MEYRLYSFNNFYLSPIQHGIQTAHAAVELMLAHGDISKYKSSPESQAVIDWATQDKTMILLNGGNCESLTKIEDIFARALFPWASFYESKNDLGGIITCVCAVIPEIIYKAELDLSESTSQRKIYSYTSEQDERGYVTNYIFRPDYESYDVVHLLKTSRLI